jgi:hypothetical protein
MSPTPAFGTQLVGQTEKALNAILERQLADTDVTEPQWVILTIAVMNGGTIDSAPFVSRVVGALKITDVEAQARMDELAAAGLLEAVERDGERVSVTAAGSDLHARIRTAVSEITQRLWGDLPAEDLATAGRVLATVLERANAELAHQ